MSTAHPMMLWCPGADWCGGDSWGQGCAHDAPALPLEDTLPDLQKRGQDAQARSALADRWNSSTVIALTA